MASFLDLCDDCKRAVMRAVAEHQDAELCGRCSHVGTVLHPRFTYGMTPPELIKLAALDQCPDGYPMTIRDPDEWQALAQAWNQGIDSHLEALTERSSADASTGLVSVHPAELHTLLRRLEEFGDEHGCSLRSAILTTLGIEEI